MCTAPYPYSNCGWTCGCPRDDLTNESTTPTSTLSYTMFLKLTPLSQWCNQWEGLHSLPATHWTWCTNTDRKTRNRQAVDMTIQWSRAVNTGRQWVLCMLCISRSHTKHRMLQGFILQPHPLHPEGGYELVNQNSEMSRQPQEMLEQACTSTSCAVSVSRADRKWGTVGIMKGGWEEC